MFLSCGGSRSQSYLADTFSSRCSLEITSYLCLLNLLILKVATSQFRCIPLANFQRKLSESSFLCFMLNPFLEMVIFTLLYFKTHGTSVTVRTPLCS